MVATYDMRCACQPQLPALLAQSFFPSSSILRKSSCPLAAGGGAVLLVTGAASAPVPGRLDVADVVNASLFLAAFLGGRGTKDVAGRGGALPVAAGRGAMAGRTMRPLRSCRSGSVSALISIVASLKTKGSERSRRAPTSYMFLLSMRALHTGGSSSQMHWPTRP